MQRHMQRRHGHLSTYQGPSMVMSAPTYQLPEIEKKEDSFKTEEENEVASEPQVNLCFYLSTGVLVITSYVHFSFLQMFRSEKN